MAQAVIMKTIVFLLLTTITLIISGCSTDSSEKPSIVSSTAELDGSWEPTASGYPFVIDNGILDVYADQGEEVEERKFSITVVGEKVTQPNNLVVQKIDITTISYSFTPLTIARVNLFNAEATCGYTDWELNVKKDVGTCGHTTTDKDIYRIERDMLLFGDRSSIGADGYPDALDGTESWIK